MKKVILASACAFALSIGGAAAQNAEGQGGQPSAKSGGVAPGAKTMKKGTGNTVGNGTGASNADRATVPGSMNAGGTSQSSPNTTQPGASKTGGNN